MSRPEHIAPPEIFYNADEARKYTANSHMIQIQSELTQRCLELLALPEGQPSYILDIGCGSGLSGEELTDAGHVWAGIDISRDMLEVAKERDTEGDLALQDMGQGMTFRPGTFDGVISVSALQWICNADRRAHNPRARLTRFFTTLFSCMAQGARAVFQFYPETPEQMELITTFAMKAGFTGGLVIDYPNSTRARKIFLCLFAGAPGVLPQAKTGENLPDDQISYTAAARQRQREQRKGGKPGVKSREWVQLKKERRRKQHGEHDARPDSKFTARKRKPRF